ncbi:hypothetical protein RB195_019846 [Necator americanus]|uniref:Reverse transcriptase domain-containing protein n=1 Tax=Necator americanus TaxID=51031 RepID=A0ABR1CIH9_NECAM
MSMAIVGLFIAELVYATGGNERWHAADKAEKVESTLSNQIELNNASIENELLLGVVGGDGITRVQDAFIDLKKAFDSAETEAVVEALDNQGVPTQYIKVLRELYSNFTTGISPFYKNIIIDVKRGVRQGDTISPKIFTATLENAMRKLEWDDMGVKIDGRQLHHLRFADDIVLITPSISQAERMLTEFDETCGYIGLQLNLQKMMFMRNDGSRMPHSRSTERTHPNAPATFIWVGN